MYFGAIEASGKKFICGIVNKKGDTVEKIIIPTETPEITMPKVIEFFKNKNIQALGLGCFGPIDLDKTSKTYGYITSTPKLAWKNYDIVGILEENLGVDVYFDTNINMAIIGEMKWGALKNTKNSLYLRIGSGIGGAAVVEGKLLHGKIHSEMGHMFVSRHPRDKFVGNCPFHGGNCLEGMASILAIEKRWNKTVQNLDESHEAWSLEAYYLAHALVNYILIFSPEKIILGGDILSNQHIYPEIRKSVIQLLNGYINLEQLFDNVDEYIISPDLGENSAYLGAVAVCMEKNL